MKKLFFTAIAMVAFSSASMANTIADEEVVEKDVKRSPCLQLYLDTYDEYVNLGFPDDAPSEAWAAYRECVYNSL